MNITKFNPPPPPPELLTRPDAAKYIGVKPQTLAVWASTGRYGLPFYRVGTLVRYDRADLDAWLARNKATHTGESKAYSP
jgi:excisionase family DNA binding protein